MPKSPEYNLMSHDEAEKEAFAIQKIAHKAIKGRGETNAPDNYDYRVAEASLPGESTKFMLPEIYRLPDFMKEKRFATVYDSSRMLSELKEQRRILDIKKSLNTPLAWDLNKKLSFYGLGDKVNGKKNEKKIVLAAEPDYLETDDNVDLEIFTDDNDKLADDIFEFFSEKVIFIYQEKLLEDDLQKNATAELKSLLHKNLSVVYGHGEIDSKIESNDNAMDILYSVYPGIQHQIRFISTWEGTPDKESYPFLDVTNKKYEKRLCFNHFPALDGYIDRHCDLATQLELLEFLKKRGHIVALKLTQNAGNYRDLPNKQHDAFAI